MNLLVNACETLEQELGQALEKIHQAGLIPEDQIRLCAIADGAPWIWKLVERLFPLEPHS